jgi:hypothetical protein
MAASLLYAATPFALGWIVGVVWIEIAHAATAEQVVGGYAGKAAGT